MTEKSCENCGHWIRDKDYDTFGECRRYPPTLHTQDTAKYLRLMDANQFPDTLYDMWCGEFKAKPA